MSYLPTDNTKPVPKIPVSPPTQTSQHRVEISPDGGDTVRISALLVGRLTVTGQRDAVVHDLDPTEALWLATQLRVTANAIIAEQSTQAGPRTAPYTAPEGTAL